MTEWYKLCDSMPKLGEKIWARRIWRKRVRVPGEPQRLVDDPEHPRVSMLMKSQWYGYGMVIEMEPNIVIPVAGCNVEWAHYEDSEMFPPISPPPPLPSKSKRPYKLSPEGLARKRAALDKMWEKRREEKGKI